MSFIKKNEIFLLGEIVKKNFSSKYKDSVLGIFWTVLSPLLLMILFTVLFSTIFSRSIENFPVYFFSGWCIYMFFSTGISSSMNSLRGNQNILKRTPAPKYIFVLGAIISELLTLVIMLIILFGVIVVTKAPIYLSTMFFSIIPIISLIIMVTGFGLMFSVICVYYTDVLHLWGVVSMFIMYGSAIFYPMSIVPEPYRQYAMLNPLYWIIDQFRCFIYFGVFPQISNVINSLLLSTIILVLGIIVFKKYGYKVTMKF